MRKQRQVHRVNRKLRDATNVKSKSPEWKIDIKTSARAGADAARQGEPRWANVYADTRARAWTWGWERSHGACEGCTQCGAGTLPAEASFSVWFARWANEERRQAQRGRASE